MANTYITCEPKSLEWWGIVKRYNCFKILVARPAEERPQAYTFTGPTGCGKSTAAKAFANNIGCDFEWGWNVYTPQNYAHRDLFEDIIKDSYQRGFENAPYWYLYFERMSPDALIACG